MVADVVAIAAVAENGVIGRNGGLPWDGYEAALERLRGETEGHPVILGRVTYEAMVDRLGGPPPGRQNIVVSETEHYKGEWVRTVNSPGSALTLALRVDDTAYIAGGESMYRTLLPLATGLILTRIPEEPEGDKRFPDVDDEEEWELVSREDVEGLELVEYERRSMLGR